MGGNLASMGNPVRPTTAPWQGRMMPSSMPPTSMQTASSWVQPQQPQPLQGGDAFRQGSLDSLTVQPGGTSGMPGGDANFQGGGNPLQPTGLSASNPTGASPWAQQNPLINLFSMMQGSPQFQNSPVFQSLQQLMGLLRR